MICESLFAKRSKTKEFTKIFSSYLVQLLVAKNLNGLSLRFEDLRIEIHVHKVIDPFLLHQKKAVFLFPAQSFSIDFATQAQGLFPLHIGPSQDLKIRWDT